MTTNKTKALLILLKTTNLYLQKISFYKSNENHTKKIQFQLTNSVVFERLDKFEQHTAGRGGMNERNEAALGTDTRCFVDQSSSIFL